MVADSIDWKALGLKCGIEIHQQLEGKKLFCSCPTLIRTDPAHRHMHRFIRAAAGETGNIDVAALQEAQKKRVIVYEYYKDSTCLVELDEEPPQRLNAEALKTALVFARMVNARVVDAAQVMRKTIVDGSNTSGFQRTTLVAYAGSLLTSFGQVGIHTVILEEDSARTVKEESTQVTYNLDRVGIPLIEVCTAPDMHEPEQVKEVAEKIGLLLRSTGRAKRGLGTIRQDVNVSIAGGTRVEIKGAQDLKLIPLLVSIEAIRQKKLLELKEVLNKKHPRDHAPQMSDVTADLRHTTARVVRTTLDQGGVILGCKFEKLCGVFGAEVQPNKRFGSECSDRAKVIAGVGGIFHSDELPKYGIEQSDVNSIRGSLCVAADDAFVLVAAEKVRAQKALAAVIARVNEAKQGVPKEVRKANEDGTTSYLRPMPTAERMYPETDVPSFFLANMDSLPVPELIEARQKRYEKMGLSVDVAELAARSEEWREFDHVLKNHTKIKPAYVAEIFFGAARAIKTQYQLDVSPSVEDFSAVFTSLEQGVISKESVLDILKENKPVAQVIPRFLLMNDKELEKQVKAIIAQNKTTPPNALIGIVMKQLRGKASGQKIAEMIKKHAGFS